MIDYSDESFDQDDSYQAYEDNATPDQTVQNPTTASSEPIEDNSQEVESDQEQSEDGYNSSVVNDYEAVHAPYDDASKDETPEQETIQPNTEQETPTYMAPATRSRVYTNEDIEQTQTDETDPN
jgi:hypothetical protein